MEPEVVAPIADESTGSLADHEADFHAVDGAAPPRDEPDDHGEPAPVPERQRARSQQATAGDVETIAQLTKRLRTAEDELGLKIERHDGESQRVFNLRRQAEIAEALRDAKKTPAAVPVPVPVVAQPAALQPEAFTEKEPTWDDVKDEADPIMALNRAVARYDRRKEAFEDRQASRQADAEKSRLEAAGRETAAIQAMYQDHGGRAAAFKAAHADYDALEDAAFKAVGQLPPLLTQTILTDDKGPELVYHLAQHLDELADLALLTRNQPVDEVSVALLRRRLHARGIVDSTGTTPLGRTPFVPARPPIPVRTGTAKTGADIPNEDTETLLQFEKRVHGDRGARRDRR